MKYLITGATGYIGSMLIKYICSMDGTNQIIALVRDRKKALRMLPKEVIIVETVLERMDVPAIYEKICSLVSGTVDYIVHGASVTKSFQMLNQPVEVTKSIINTTQNVLELARYINPLSVVFLSSMEVYGNIQSANGHRIEENEASNGVVELFCERSCYPLAKRMAENICYCYYKEYDIPVKVARLSQIFGKGVLPDDTRVFAQFARAAAGRQNIVLHTKGNSMGNFCDIEDAITAIMTILHKGCDGECYNVVNEDNTMSIRQMAELVCEKITGGDIDIEYNIVEGSGYAPDTGLRLSGQKLMNLGWKPKKCLENMYRDMMTEL